MKKMFLSAAAVAVTFVAFAFAPVGENNSLDNIVKTEVEVFGGRCETQYTQNASFSKCNKTWTETVEAEFAALTRVLDAY